MSPKESPPDLDGMLAALLQVGTWLACIVIAVGLAIAAYSAGTGAMVAAAGIVLFIALPVTRVATMLVLFVRARDYRLGGIAALVLVIIFSSYLIGAQ
jgi:uncharacterized membrane protein